MQHGMCMAPKGASTSTTPAHLGVVPGVHLAINWDNIGTNDLQPLLFKPYLVHVDILGRYILIPTRQTRVLLCKKYTTNFYSGDSVTTNSSPHDCQLTTGHSAPSLPLAHVQMLQTSVETSTHLGKATCTENGARLVNVWPLMPSDIH